MCWLWLRTSQNAAIAHPQARPTPAIGFPNEAEYTMHRNQSTAIFSSTLRRERHRNRALGNASSLVMQQRARLHESYSRVCQSSTLNHDDCTARLWLGHELGQQLAHPELSSTPLKLTGAQSHFKACRGGMPRSDMVHVADIAGFARICAHYGRLLAFRALQQLSKLDATAVDKALAKIGDHAAERSSDSSSGSPRAEEAPKRMSKMTAAERAARFLQRQQDTSATAQVASKLAASRSRMGSSAFPAALSTALDWASASAASLAAACLARQLAPHAASGELARQRTRDLAAAARALPAAATLPPSRLGDSPALLRAQRGNSGAAAASPSATARPTPRSQDGGTLVGVAGLLSSAVGSAAGACEGLRAGCSKGVKAALGTLNDRVDLQSGPDAAMRLARARFCEVERRLSGGGVGGVASGVTLPVLMQQGNSRMFA